MTFSAAFDVFEVQTCPYYNKDDSLVLTEGAAVLPVGRPACLILVRKLTELLFDLMPFTETNFAEQRDTIYSCGGCTGLIKFKLAETPKNGVDSGNDEGEVVMSGRVDAISPAELLQVFHMHQKTGKLLLDTDGGSGMILFRHGGIVSARFGEQDNQEAVYSMMAEKHGHFRFLPGLPDPLRKAREIDDFMMILMEGHKRLDEDKK